MGATCSTATVVSGSTCSSIAMAAGITLAQLESFNPNVDCSTLQIGQPICITAGTPPGPPQENSNGSCATYTTVAGDSCSAIAARDSITVAEIETWNTNTFHWTGCADLQVNFSMCVSAGTPPPPPIIAGLQCGPQSAGNATCPLNACCSAFGFCGLTDEFCTTTGANPCISNCGEPTLPSCGTTGAARKIGYYAGWGNRRACGTNVAPNEIDWTGFTAAHFAFATISQGSQIQLDDADVSLLQELVAQKATYPALKVVIAVGGWAFSEEDPTRDLFSVMISTTATRATFISSVEALLTQYGLDGIDIDFEYPSAIERAAPATDTPDLTAFFQQLRTALPTQIISCATPAGYWFLQGFEIDKIVQSVTYLNMMSYDYHGLWDTNVTDQAPVTNPHTSILDMQASASLYVRAGINLNIVNLGLAYYGRTYQLASSSCVGYNCTMVGGGFAGSCTASSGILAQFEIETLLQSGITPTLDKSSETYWFDDSGSLVTFDQQDTWAAKTTFSETTCFGGTFIWSLDQVTSDPGDGGGPPVTPPSTGPPQSKCTLVQGWVSNWVDYTATKYWVPFINSPTGPGGPTPPPTGDLDVPQAWETPVLWEAIISWLLANNVNPSAKSDATFDLGISEFITVDAGPFPAPTEAEFGGGNDDILWAALGWMRYYEYVLSTTGSKPPSNILSTAQSFINLVASNRNDAPCPGGVFWKSGKTGEIHGKNTITNALFIHASAKYYLLTNVESYRDQALDVWNWVAANGLQRSDSLYSDGPAGCGSGPGEVWTYNQGEMIAAAGTMALAFNNSTYISLGNATAYSVINNVNGLLSKNGILTETGNGGCDINFTCDDDQHSFKGIFMRGLEYLLDAANDPALASIYAPWIGYQVRAITDNAQASSGDVGNVWSVKTTQVFGGEVIGMAISAGNAAAKYGTSNGTFTC